MSRITPLLILLCFVASACSPQPALQTTLPVPVPSEIIPTRTLDPTNAPTAIPTASQTPSPTVITEPNKSPTPPGMAVFASAFRFGRSSDGNWFWGVEGLGSQEEGTELIAHKTNISSADGKTQWTVWPKTIDTSDIIETQAIYEPFFWSPDELYVYLTGDSCCQDGAYGHTGMNLARLDLRTGDFAILVSGWNPRSFAFSQLGEYLLVTEYKIPRLRFIRLSDWKITDISIDPKYVHNELGAFSLDANRAVVQTCEELGDTLGCYRRGLLLVDIQKANFRVLIEDMDKALKLESDRLSAHDLSYDWKNDNELEITVQRRGENDRIFVFDLLTNPLDEIRQD